MMNFVLPRLGLFVVVSKSGYASCLNNYLMLHFEIQPQNEISTYILSTHIISTHIICAYIIMACVVLVVAVFWVLRL
jgi:hypothetical protein